jgi:hypothetical protein
MAVVVRRSLVLLALSALAATASAQTVQTGLFYWCSFIEGGINFSPSFTTLPRTTWLGRGSGFTSAPCHTNNYNAGIQSTDLVYNFSNGTAYPTNLNCGISPYCAFNIAPTTCQTADNWATDSTQCMVPGFGYTPLYVANGASNPVSSFPITYDQKQVWCTHGVVETPLVARLQQTLPPWRSPM